MHPDGGNAGSVGAGGASGQMPARLLGGEGSGDVALGGLARGEGGAAEGDGDAGGERVRDWSGAEAVVGGVGGAGAEGDDAEGMDRGADRSTDCCADGGEHAGLEEDGGADLLRGRANEAEDG